MARTPTPGSPAAAGYRRRAEWEPHRCTWLVWPHCQDTWPGLDLGSAVAPAYIEMVRALREGETVHLIAQSDTHAQNVRQRLAAAGIESEIAPSTDEEEDAPPAVPVQIHVWPTDDEWIRDFGALVVRDGEGRRLATDWRFNAWGGKYPRTEQNNTVPELMANVHGLGREGQRYIRKVADCEAHIAKNDESMKEETGIRTKENGEYQVQRLRLCMFLAGSTCLSSIDPGNSFWGGSSFSVTLRS